jgi:hypothetical protein
VHTESSIVDFVRVTIPSNVQSRLLR